MSETTGDLPKPLDRHRIFDDAVGRRVVDLHIWAVEQGLDGADAETLFDNFCQRLVAAGTPLWRAFAGMNTLHPQWSGYGYTWRRDLNAIQPASWARIEGFGPDWHDSPFAYMLRQAEANPGEPVQLRRRLTNPDASREFPVFSEFAAAGATDYFARVFGFGAEGDPSFGSGIAYSFITQHAEGWSDDDLTLLNAVLPAVSLAMMSHATHTIARSLLAAYLGADAGRRVHAGAIERGSVESIHAVLWYADLRGFTAIADASGGTVLVELLDDVFETLAASLRPRGGEVLKFMGDGMLAIFPVAGSCREAICRSALDAAGEAMRALETLNETRRRAGKPVAAVDVALHVGEVLYGNIGAADRLDFTVIGPAVNEVARMEALCEPLGRKVLVSAELAAAGAVPSGRLEPLGRHLLRGVRTERELFALVLDAPPRP